MIVTDAGDQAVLNQDWKTVLVAVILVRQPLAVSIAHQLRHGSGILVFSCPEHVAALRRRCAEEWRMPIRIQILYESQCPLGIAGVHKLPIEWRAPVSIAVQL